MAAREIMAERGAWTLNLLRADADAADGLPLWLAQQSVAYGALTKLYARSALKLHSVGKGGQDGASSG